MRALGGLPLAIKIERSNLIGVQVSESKAALSFSLFVLLVPGVTILALVLTLPIVYDFNLIMASAGFTFWDTFGIVLVHGRFVLAKYRLN